MIDFPEDDSDAMLALLRHIYHLPYDGHQAEVYQDRLSANVAVYLVAKKYQASVLQEEVFKRMRAFLRPKDTPKLWDINLRDFIKALRIVFTGITPSTPQDEPFRCLMVETCITILPILRDEDEFLTTLRELGELGAAIVGYRRLSCCLPGALVCGECLGARYVRCRHCEKTYSQMDIWRHADEDDWTCPNCSKRDTPQCGKCDGDVYWVTPNSFDRGRLISHW